MPLIGVIALFIFPQVISLIFDAEQTFTQPSSGAQKKQFVMDSIGKIISMMLMVSTGGQLGTWQAISKMSGFVMLGIADFIDFACAVQFPHEDKPEDKP